MVYTAGRPHRRGVISLDKDYLYYLDALQGRLLPCAYVDLDRFDRNVQDIAARAHGRRICVASKSVRSVALLKRIFHAGSPYHSIMAFSLREAVYLTQNGLDQILVAYPVWREVEHSGIFEALRGGKTITLMIDCLEHVEYLQHLAERANVTVPVCIDLDLSTDFPGIHFGVRRSGITTPQQAVSLFNVMRELPNVRLDGLMGYEAQIAGLPDTAPWNRPKNTLIKILKRRSLREIRARRSAVVEALRDAGAELRFVNGGGTGSVESTIEEELVTETTVGSGFYCPVQFDWYTGFRHLPAAGFAIEITRQPTEHIYTCHGGGYIASGPAGPEKLPQPYLPTGAKLLPLEGAGEVQTPIEYKGPVKLSLGDPVFMRHYKAGELCERFKTLLLISKGAVVDEVLTYRGDGQCFL
ncbi:MAG: amino acid deaminase/aldolase [Candidatus Hydrogenedentes bacterium]|nr:amino acid deaminase/aldolase [Candidatus Hydrogenedentota bacterium]